MLYTTNYYVSIFLTILIIAIATNISSSNTKQSYLQQLLTSDRTEWQQFPIRYIPIPKLNSDIWHQTQLTKSQIYDSNTVYPPKHSFNYLISDIDDIEIIINETDKIATKQWIDGFKEELSHEINVSDRFYQLQKELGGKYNLSIKERSTDDIEINGFDTAYFHSNPSEGKVRSTGMNGEYFMIEKTCAQLKGCNVYPIFRVLHKSVSLPNGESFSCNDIMNELLPQIYECVDEYGADKCPMLITNGYFRDVFKVKVPNTNKYVILKMQRPKKYDDWARDIQRHVRESIFLYYIKKEEMEYIDTYGAVFVSDDEERAFPYVRELGHCVYPSYISVYPYYNLTLEYFIKSGIAATKSISQLMKMALEMAKATEMMHNIRGGPFHHTDIGIDQYMIDVNGHVLLNDFNRGKFQPYRFAEDFKDGKVGDGYNGVVKCSYCPYDANGRNRAPEELVCEPSDESIDVYSTALSIWSLFTGTRLWTKPLSDPDEDSMENENSLTFEDVSFVVHETVRKPIMPYNMPYALKEVIRWAITHDPMHRPSAIQFRRGIEDVYKNLDKYTRNRASMISVDARRKKVFKDHHYPKVPHNFPKCCIRGKMYKKKTKR